MFLDRNVFETVSRLNNYKRHQDNLEKIRKQKDKIRSQRVQQDPQQLEYKLRIQGNRKAVIKMKMDEANGEIGKVNALLHSKLSQIWQGKRISVPRFNEQSGNNSLFLRNHKTLAVQTRMLKEQRIEKENAQLARRLHGTQAHEYLQRGALASEYRRNFLDHKVRRMNSHYAAQKLILGIKDPNNLRTPKYTSSKGNESIANLSHDYKERSDADSIKNDLGRFRDSAGSQLSLNPDFDSDRGPHAASNYRDSASDRSRLSNFTTDVYELNKQYRAWKDKVIVEKYHGFLQGVLDFRRRQIHDKERKATSISVENDYDVQNKSTVLPSSDLSVNDPSVYRTP